MRNLIAAIISFLLASAAQAADFYVSPTGSDSSAGTSALPFRTIQKGISAAGSPGDTVTVAAGTYHEELTLGGRGSEDHPIVLKAAQKQTAVLDGAVRVKGWRQLDKARNIWSVEFGHQAPYNNDKGRWDMPPRSEQVFVDGKMLSHAKDDTAADAMAEWSFTATLSDPAKYTLRLPQGLDPDAATTEITVSPSLLTLDRPTSHVTIDGFTFRRAQNTYQKALVLIKGESVEVRNCVFEYSSAGSGMAIMTRHGRIHDNIFRSNGQFAFSLGGQSNVIENNLVTGNDRAGYTEWGTGGTKIVGNGNILRHNRFIDNLGGVAIWLDCGPCDNVIEYNYVSGNHGEGIRAEICYHNYIGYNIVENTQPCQVTMFGKTSVHCLGISVQNSAETFVVNNFLKDNRSTAIQVFAYNRKATDLPHWQHFNEKQKQWLQKSWDSGVIFANDNLVLNNVIVQTLPEIKDPCVWFRGRVNGESPQVFGNQFDYNFYWNSATGAPKVRIKDFEEVPNGQSKWQTKYGLDTHAMGGFSPQDYRQSVFADAYPFAPLANFAGFGKGTVVPAFPGHADVDYFGNPPRGDGHESIGHIRAAAAKPASRPGQ